MKRIAKRTLALLLSLLVLLLTLLGCDKATLPEGAAQNDILTFQNNADNKPIIRIGTQYYTPDTSLLDALQEMFPTCLFVLDYGAAAGQYSEIRCVQDLKEGNTYYDMLISGSMELLTSEKGAMLTDLSAEPFINNYLHSSLNSVSVEGYVYTLPGTSTLSGIAFNVDMFEEHGWAIPASSDEFFALCDEIKAAGIQPFSTCAKYIGQLNRLLTLLTYSELFGTVRGAAWLDAVQRNEADFAGFIEPMYDMVKRLGDAGALTPADFTASLTKQRQAFWAGEYAMIDYDSAIFSYAESENAPFEIGIMPYPAKEAENAGFAISTEYYISIPKVVEQNPERLALMKEILGFISTAKGQEALLGESLRVSNIKGVNLSGNPAMKYATEAYEKGNLYPIVTYAKSPNIPFLTLQQEAILSVLEGTAINDAIAKLDAQVDAAFAAGVEEPTYEVIATAEEPFTMLETSYYIADKFRALTGADVGLMINRGFFRSNLAKINQGDVTNNMNTFVLKGVGAEDYLTSYRLTGAQLKTLLEHPIVNNEEIDALIACSGLKIEYAPWNERGNRVVSLTLADGSALDDEALYTVAAWAGTIAETYISETIRSYDTLGSFSNIMENAFRSDKTIRPDIADRVKLIWPTVK